MHAGRSFRTRALALGIVVALAFTATACGRFSRRSSAPPTPVGSVGYGDGTSIPPATRPKLAGTGTIVVRVLDDRNRPVNGAVVRFKGPQSVDAATNERGIVQRALRAGVYELSLAPCGTRVVMLDQREAQAVVVAGRQGVGELIGARWERRFKPSPSVRYSSNPPWKVGQNVSVFVRVEDRCTYGAAKNATLTGYGWRSSSHYGFTARPVMRSDAEGNARAAIRCLKEGDGHVTIYDGANREDSINVLLAGPGPGSGRRFCER